MTSNCQFNPFQISPALNWKVQNLVLRNISNIKLLCISSYNEIVQYYEFGQKVAQYVFGYC